MYLGGLRPPLPAQYFGPADSLAKNTPFQIDTVSFFLWSSATPRELSKRRIKDQRCWRFFKVDLYSLYERRRQLAGVGTPQYVTAFPHHHFLALIPLGAQAVQRVKHTPLFSRTSCDVKNTSCHELIATCILRTTKMSFPVWKCSRTCSLASTFHNLFCESLFLKLLIFPIAQYSLALIRTLALLAKLISVKVDVRS